MRAPCRSSAATMAGRADPDGETVTIATIQVIERGSLARRVSGIEHCRRSTRIACAPCWRRRCCARAGRSACCTMRRLEVRPFTEQQIALLETFADQAVIAIENARLFEELEQRNAELSGGAGAADRHRRVLRVIASSPTDLAAGARRDRREWRHDSARPQSAAIRRAVGHGRSTGAAGSAHGLR